MRVIAGKARRVTLVTPSGRNTRPTTDRIKETLFNMLQPEIAGTSFLDIFSGSGGIGIEAVSRGASHAVLIEHDRKAVLCIKENLRRTHLEEEISLMPMDALRALRALGAGGRQFDLVFMDPPYCKDMEKSVLMALCQEGILAEGALVVVEAALETPVEPMLQGLYVLDRVKEYKSNKHIFLRAAD